MKVWELTEAEAAELQGIQEQHAMLLLELRRSQDAQASFGKRLRARIPELRAGTITAVANLRIVGDEESVNAILDAPPLSSQPAEGADAHD